MTSLAFMFDDVPEPVWNTSIGNCASNSPAATRSRRLRIAFACVFFRCPRSALACAAADLISPSARMNSRGIGRPEIGKLSTARWVCAPYSASAGTFSSPMLSRSMRYSLIAPPCDQSGSRQPCMRRAIISGVGAKLGSALAAAPPMRLPRRMPAAHLPPPCPPARSPPCPRSTAVTPPRSRRCARSSANTA